MYFPEAWEMKEIKVYVKPKTWLTSLKVKLPYSEAHQVLDQKLRLCAGVNLLAA